MSCTKCGDVCKCINISSADGAIIIERVENAYGCDFQIKLDEQNYPMYSFTFNYETRKLCVVNSKGIEINCVNIPEKDQLLYLDGNTLTISDGNSIELPENPELEISSSSLRVQQRGVKNHEVLIEIVPSIDQNNSLILGSDGRPFVPKSSTSGSYEDLLNSNVVFKKNVTVEGILQANSDFNVKGNTILNGFTTVNNDVKVNGKITTDYIEILKDLLIRGNLTVLGDSNLQKLTVKDVVVTNSFTISQGGETVYPIVYRGVWDANTMYFKNNQVTYNGKIWIYTSTNPTIGNVPYDGSSYWSIYLDATITNKYTELRYAKNGSSTVPPSINKQVSMPTGWTLNPPTLGATEYLWMSQAQKDSYGTLLSNWSDPVRLSGLIGPPGSNGSSANQPFKSIVFIRSQNMPSTPIGGTWANPVPTGWYDGIPSGTLQVWMSTRIFTNDGLTPQQSSWTTPSELTDTSTTDYSFSSVATSPGTPDTAPNNWYDDANVNTIWMAMRTITNGVLGQWQVIKIKGEDGKDGLPGAAGKKGPAGPFLSYAGNYDATVQYYGGEDRITAVYYGGAYYVTRTDAGGNIPAGTLPTNTLYWNKIEGQFQSIATGLLLAQIAYIKNLGVSFLRTGSAQPGVSGTEHIEIYPSLETLQGFRSQGDDGYTGLTDSDLKNLANSIIFYNINDTGARDTASVNAYATMLLRALTPSNPFYYPEIVDQSGNPTNNTITEGPLIYLTDNANTMGTWYDSSTVAITSGGMLLDNKSTTPSSRKFTSITLNGINTRGYVKVQGDSTIGYKTAYLDGMQGIFSNVSKTSFYPATTGIETNASVVGLLQSRSSNNSLISGLSAAVAGVDQTTASDGNSKSYGGFFNTLFAGKTYTTYKSIPQSTQSYTLTEYDTDVHCYNTSTLTIQLPYMALNSDTNNSWNSGGSHNRQLVIYIRRINAQVNVNVASGNVIVGKSGQLTNIKITDPGEAAMLVWNGSQWLANKLTGY